MSEWVTQSFRLRLGAKRPSRKTLMGVITQWNYPYCGLTYFMRQWWLSLSHQPGLDILFCLQGDGHQEDSCGWIIADTQPARLVVWQQGRLALIEQGDVDHLINQIQRWQVESGNTAGSGAWCWCSHQAPPSHWCGSVLAEKEWADSFVRLVPVEHITQRSSALLNWGLGFFVLASLVAAAGYTVLTKSAAETEHSSEQQVVKRIDSVALVNQLGMLMSQPFYNRQQLTRIDVSDAGMRLTWQMPATVEASMGARSRVETRPVARVPHIDIDPSDTAAMGTLLRDYRQQFFDAEVIQRSPSQWVLTLDMMSFRHLNTLLRWLQANPQFSLSSLTMRYQHGYWSVQWTLDNSLAQPH